MKEKLHPYLDGELSTPEAMEIEAALEADPNLRAELEELKAVSLMARAALEGPTHDVDLSGVFAGVKRQLEPSETHPAELGLFDKLARMLGLDHPTPIFAGALAFALIGGLWLGGVFDTPMSEPSTQLAGAESTSPGDTPSAVKKPIGQRRGIETETVRQTAFVDHVEATKGRVVVDIDSQNPSRPIVIWHHVDGDESPKPETPEPTPPKEL
jgi:anti-sigma factor RsiW